MSWRARVVIAVLAASICCAHAAACWNTAGQLDKGRAGYTPAPVTDASGNWGPPRTYFYASHPTDLGQVGTIWRVNLDGKNKTALMCQSGCSCAYDHFQQPTAIVVDKNEGWLYWKTYGHIGRVRLDGSCQKFIVVCSSAAQCANVLPNLDAWSNLPSRQSLVIDNAYTGRVYWTGKNVIGRAWLNGAGADLFVCAGATCTGTVLFPPVQPHALKVARTSDNVPRLFWAEEARIVALKLTAPHAITVLASDGSGLLTTSGQRFLDVDVTSGPNRVYFSDGPRIQSVNALGGGLAKVVCHSDAGCTSPPGGITAIQWIGVVGAVVGKPVVYWMDRGYPAANRLQRVFADGTSATTLMCGPGCSGAVGQQYARFHYPLQVSTDAWAPFVATPTPVPGITWLDGDEKEVMRIQHFTFNTSKVIEVQYIPKAFQYFFSDFRVWPSAWGAGFGYSAAGRVVTFSNDSCVLVAGGPPASQLVCPDGCDRETGKVGDPSSLNFDITAGKVYFADATRRSISRMWKNGTGVEVLVCNSGCVNAHSSISRPRDLRVDLRPGVPQKMYWLDAEAQIVFRANLDGTGVEKLLCKAGCANAHAFVESPEILRLDTRISNEVPWLYWIDWKSNSIMKIKGDGTGKAVVVCKNGCGVALGANFFGESIADSQDNWPDDFLLDGQYAYWLDRWNHHVARVNIDTSAVDVPLCKTNITGKCKYIKDKWYFAQSISIIKPPSPASSYLYLSYDTQYPAPAEQVYVILRLKIAAGFPTAPQNVLCTNAVACPNVSPSLLDARWMTLRGTSQLWFTNRKGGRFGGLGPAGPWPTGVFSIRRCNLDGTNPEVMVDHQYLIPDGTPAGVSYS